MNSSSPGASAARPGFHLGQSDYARESSAYLQQRLRFLYAVLAAGATAFLLLDHLVLLSTGVYSLEAVTRPSELLHIGSLLLAWLLLALLRMLPFDGRALVLFDGAALFLASGTTLGIWAFLYDGPSTTTLLSVTCIFLLARAVVVPSSVRRTVLLSLPVAVAVGAIQLARGRSPYGEEALAGLGTHDDLGILIWTEGVVLFAVAVAAFASHVTFALRRQVREAESLGQYRLDSKIGEGGMGEVYKATHAMLRRPTAIKLLRPELTGEETLRRFEREVRETSRLSHPNTVGIYDYGRTPDGLFYYAMEYLNGVSLKDLVERDGPLPPARVIHILVQACGALHEAHGLGLVHRDIKPGNLMLCERAGEHDVVKVVDFGLVKDFRSADPGLTQLGSVCGTPEAMAPEVIGGDPAQPASDLYGLGIVGYYLLCGRPIFHARTPGEFIGHHLHTPPVPLRERAPATPPDLENAIMRCLEKDPQRRPKSAAALRAELQACAFAGAWSEEDAANASSARR